MEIKNVNPKLVGKNIEISFGDDVVKAKLLKIEKKVIITASLENGKTEKFDIDKIQSIKLYAE